MSLKDFIESNRVPAEQCGELNDKTVNISRVAKVVKGGRRFSFGALVVTGDGRGHVGYGWGKAGEVPDAIRKASEEARRNLVRVPIQGTTIPHEVIGRYGASTAIVKPGVPGTGVISASVGRAIMEAVGIRDVRVKCVGSSNPHNLLKAIMTALGLLKEPEAVAAARGVDLEELGYRPF